MIKRLSLIRSTEGVEEHIKNTFAIAIAVRENIYPKIVCLKMKNVSFAARRMHYESM